MTAEPYKLTRTYRKLVENTTINSRTLLSTDYLNHFNEVVMMIDLVPDMPDMLSEAQDWRPKTYAEHFADSAFQHKDLAIAAYDQALDQDRTALEATVARLDLRIERSLKMMQALVNVGDIETLRNLCGNVSRDLQALIDSCSGVINGVEGAALAALHAAEAAPSEEEPSAPEPIEETAEGEEAVVMDQDAIDALFD